MKPVFYIAFFPEDNSVALVPSNWLLDNNTKSHWPDTDDSTAVKLAKKAVDPLGYPGIEWGIFDCTIRCGSDSYERARAGLEKAVEESEVELTETEGEATGIGRRLRKRSNRNRDGAFSASDSTTKVTSQAVPTCPNTERNTNDLNQPIVFNITEFQNIFAENTDGDQVQLVIANEPPVDIETSNSSTFANRSGNTPDCVLTTSVENSAIAELAENFNSLSKEVRDFQKVVLRQLVNIASDVSELIRISTQNTGTGFGEEFQVPGVTFPINLASEFQLLDVFLGNKDNKTLFVRFLKGIGGMNTENFVKRILVRTIGGDLANAANFTGKRDKIKFPGHQLINCIIAAVRKNPEDSQPTNSEVEAIVAKWLLGSGDRNVGRAERQKKKQPAQGEN